jgi:hypothetical protein
MGKLLDEIKCDLTFVRSHTLQPGWYKLLKVFIVLAFLLVYYLLFGMLKTLLFFAVFILLSLVVHMLYRWKTEKYTKSWLDFIVVEEGGMKKPNRIGIFYYLAIVVNASVSILVSQVLV